MGGGSAEKAVRIAEMGRGETLKGGRGNWEKKKRKEVEGCRVPGRQELRSKFKQTGLRVRVAPCVRFIRVKRKVNKPLNSGKRRGQVLRPRGGHIGGKKVREGGKDGDSGEKNWVLPLFGGGSQASEDHMLKGLCYETSGH